MKAKRTTSGWKTGLKISLAYAVFGFLWIAYSDRFLESMSSDPGFLTRMQTYKGWAYVFVTACLIFVLVRHYVFRLLGSFDRLRESGIKLLIIDTPPAITSTIGHAINVADLVVIPTRPSPHDLRAAGKTVDIAERLDKPLVFVLNGAHPRARITAVA